MTTTYRHVADENRYVAEENGTRAGLIDYDLDGDVVVITHTETDPAVQGQGVAAGLTRFALDDIRAAGRRLRPECPYTRSWVQRHPDYQDLLA